MTAMVHSSPYVSSRSRGYNPRSPSITNGYALVLLLSALATAVAFSGTSHSIVYSTYNENAPAFTAHLSSETASDRHQNYMKAFKGHIMARHNSVSRRKEQRHHGDSFISDKSKYPIFPT